MGTVPKFNEDAIHDSMQRLAAVDLGFIEEGDEDKETDDEEEEEQQVPKTIRFSPSKVAQAFSHFTHCASG